MILTKQIVKRIVMIGALAVLAACGSSIKLDEVPVSDAKSSSVSPLVPLNSAGAAQSAQAGSVQRSVQPVSVMPVPVADGGPAGTLKVVLFDYDSFEIRPEYQAAIDAHARFLVANKARKLAVEGHTDESGGREYNLALGQKRAEAVRRALGLLGVVDSQVEAVSFGEEKPADAASNEQAYAKNRRAELSYR